MCPAAYMLSGAECGASARTAAASTVANSFASPLQQRYVNPQLQQPQQQHHNDLVDLHQQRNAILHHQVSVSKLKEREGEKEIEI